MNLQELGKHLKANNLRIKILWMRAIDFGVDNNLVSTCVIPIKFDLWTLSGISLNVKKKFKFNKVSNMKQV